jgi:hypothetical protein
MRTCQDIEVVKLHQKLEANIVIESPGFGACNEARFNLQGSLSK